MALAMFEEGQREATSRGLLLVDTKYEFGLSPEGNVLLVDEVHTPDSSRCGICGPTSFVQVGLSADKFLEDLLYMVEGLRAAKVCCEPFCDLALCHLHLVDDPQLHICTLNGLGS